MSMVSMPLIRHHARCKGCGHRFTFHDVSEFEYGPRLGRTPDCQELGLVDGLHDSVFQEVGDLVAEFLELSGKEDWQKAQCFNAVFGIACDRAPCGYLYDFTGKVWCPVCGSNEISYGPDVPPQVDVINLHVITHNAWQQLSEAEKRERLREALQKAGCLP